MLFFFAGYEIDFERIRGRPMGLGGSAGRSRWRSPTGSAGISPRPAWSLVPLHRLGARDDRDRHADPDPARRGRAADALRHLPARGRGAGEFGPILLVTLVCPAASPPHETAILVAFVALALVTGLVAVRYAWRGWAALEATFEASSQLAIRLTVVLVFGLVALASQLGLDLLLGGFVAGLITAAGAARARGGGVRVEADRGRLRLLRSRSSSSPAASSSTSTRSARPEHRSSFRCSSALFLVVRGVPALLLYRGVLAPRPAALGFYLRDRASAGRRDHDDRGRRRQHALLDRGRPGRRGDALDPDLPLRRAGAAQGR